MGTSGDVRGIGVMLLPLVMGVGGWLRLLEHAWPVSVGGSHDDGRRIN